MEKVIHCRCGLSCMNVSVPAPPASMRTWLSSLVGFKQPRTARLLTLYSHNAIPTASATNVLDTTRINTSCDTARYIYRASKPTYRYIPFHGTVRFDSGQGQSCLYRKPNLLRNRRCRDENPPSIHRIYRGAEIGIHARFEHVTGGACVKSGPNKLQFLVNGQEDDL